jgi:two-component system, cell cycle sensor histidine kinase and response regulator CckA
LHTQVEERKDIETHLLNVHKLEAIGTLAGDIAHEFNNLLTAIFGNAVLIKKIIDPKDPVIQKADKILSLIDEGSSSIKQLLGFARNGNFEPGHLNLNERIKLNLEIFSRTRKKIEIITQYAQDLWTIYADKQQVEQIIMDLFLNASDAMPRKGILSVETQNVVLEKTGES